MTVLVTALEGSAGKTAVALALARAAAERGERVGYMKPTGTRPQSAVGETRDGDPTFAREVLDLDEEVHELEPVVYSPAFVQSAIRGREDPEALREQVRTRFEALAEGRDLMVVEGGGTLTTGGAVDLSDADVADLLDATVVLVARYEEPGDVDDVLAAADLLEDRLGGVLFNAVPDAAFDALASDVVPFLEGRGIRVFGTVPRVADLAGVSVAELADDLAADVLTERAPTDRRVQRFVVGASSATDVLERLDRQADAALVVGGDRSALQLAALSSSGVACLLLTGGSRPEESVLERAETAAVPVVLARTDVRTTLDRAAAAVASGRALDPRTVDRMDELLADYADVDAMLDGRPGDPGE